ncbi:hypothetical protein [Candidatus Uabimicrobium sp. HlEnr_7]|uniref:leucine-rich repeat domain-containing protein n=1 Tax=Candidatus Uabimicrobium helgolandensis TaxID=3095367 RepID=UPI003558B386
MKKIQTAQQIENDQNYRDKVFYLDKQHIQRWRNINFENCSFRGDIVVGEASNCTFTACGFSGNISIVLSNLNIEKIPKWCFAFPSVNRLKIKDYKISALPENIAKLKNVTDLDLSFCQSLTTLRGLDLLPHLRKLNLQYCSSLSNFEDLGKIPRLLELYLENEVCENASILQWPNLQSLQKLCIQNSVDRNIENLCHLINLTHLQAPCLIGMRYSDLEVLGNLDKLKYLDLSKSISLTKTTSLSMLAQLEHLDLSYGALRKIDFSLPHLKTLKLSHCRELKDIDLLHTFTNLRSLELDNCTELEKFSIKGLRKLRHINVQFSKTQEEIDNLSIASSELEHLNIQDCQSLKKLSRHNNYKNLKYLGLSGKMLSHFDFTEMSDLQTLDLNKVYLDKPNPSLFANLKSMHCLKIDSYLPKMDKLDHVRELHLSYCTLDHFTPLPNIKSLHLFFCNFANESALLNWPSVEYLYIKNGSTTQYITAVRHLNHLTSLHIEGGTLQNLDALIPMANLKELTIENCYYLENIDALVSLTNLQSLTLDVRFVNNLSCLGKLNLQSLKLIHCPQNYLDCLDNLPHTDISIFELSP